MNQNVVVKGTTQLYSTKYELRFSSAQVVKGSKGNFLWFFLTKKNLPKPFMDHAHN